jgi:DNA polymerase-3 subunit gamma/tau
MEPPAAYQVVARRYRPQRFDELVGQEHVARGLSGAITSGRIGHAYLFTGARGVGKTSAARIFAKALECAAGPAAEPCNACDSCREIAAGQDVDVVEIDAASNRGIDEIRQLRQNVAVRPARGRFKVYIIDEVHMLTREAFNALLKTLEEPPGHVKFVLCTTEPDKLPITILSRCQRFDFTVVEPAAIARRLAAICVAEGADVSPRALEVMARRAAGSMRDSQSLLEQLLGSSTGPVDVDDVHALIGTGRDEWIATLIGALVARDAPAALAALDAAVRGGADAGGVLDQLLAALRECLLASVGCGPELLGAAGDIGIDLADVGRRLGTSTLLAMLQILDHALARMQQSGHAGVLAEMAVVRLARLEDLDALADAVAAVANTGGEAATGPVASRPGGPAGPAPARPMPPARSMPDAPTRREPAAEPRGTVPAPEPAPDHAPAPREKKTAEVTAAAAADRRVDEPTSAPVTAVASPPRAPAALPARPPAAPGGASRQAGAAAGPEPRDGPAERPRAHRSQAALVREATAHPLVARARDLFDAAIRRVDPPRPTAPGEAAPTPPAPGPPADDEEPADDPDENA